MVCLSGSSHCRARLATTTRNWKQVLRRRWNQVEVMIFHICNVHSIALGLDKGLSLSLSFSLSCRLSLSFALSLFLALSLFRSLSLALSLALSRSIRPCGGAREARVVVKPQARAKREQLKTFQAILPESQGQNLVLTVIYVPAREIFIDNLLVRVHWIIEMIVVERPCAKGV